MFFFCFFFYVWSIFISYIFLNIISVAAWMNTNGWIGKCCWSIFWRRERGLMDWRRWSGLTRRCTNTLSEHCVPLNSRKDIFTTLESFETTRNDLFFIFSALSPFNHSVCLLNHSRLILFLMPLADCEFFSHLLHTPAMPFALTVAAVAAEHFFEKMLMWIFFSASHWAKRAICTRRKSLTCCCEAHAYDKNKKYVRVQQ